MKIITTTVKMKRHRAILTRENERYTAMIGTGSTDNVFQTGRVLTFDMAAHIWPNILRSNYTMN